MKGIDDENICVNLYMNKKFINNKYYCALYHRSNKTF